MQDILYINIMHYKTSTLPPRQISMGANLGRTLSINKLCYILGRNLRILFIYIPIIDRLLVFTARDVHVGGIIYNIRIRNNNYYIYWKSRGHVSGPFFFGDQHHSMEVTRFIYLFFFGAFCGVPRWCALDGAARTRGQ